MIAETYLQLLTNVPHWAFEATSDVVFAGVGALFARIWVKRHDRKHHEPEVTMPVLQEMFRLQARFGDMRLDRLQARIDHLQDQLDQHEH